MVFLGFWDRCVPFICSRIVSNHFVRFLTKMIKTNPSFLLEGIHMTQLGSENEPGKDKIQNKTQPNPLLFVTLITKISTNQQTERVYLSLYMSKRCNSFLANQ